MIRLENNNFINYCYSYDAMAVELLVYPNIIQLLGILHIVSTRLIINLRIIIGF